MAVVRDGWSPVVTHGDNVLTPHGTGVVRRISQANGTAQVDVDGQLFEVPLSEIAGQPAPASEGEDFKREERERVSKPVQPWSARAGQRVQSKSNPNRKGEITEVTQRTVKVKWDKGGRAMVPKREVSRHLEHETIPQPQPEKKPEPEQKKEEQTPKPAEQKTQEVGDGLYDLFKIKEHLEKKVDQDVDGELKDLREQIKKTRRLEVKVGDKVNVVEGLKHKQLEQLITYATLRLSPLLVGMAGTGKTHAGEQVATALGLQFYSMSVGAQTSKSDIIGYMSANGEYVRTHFRDAYEHGGVFLMDEIDAGNANVLIQINAALSNGLCAFPDAMVKKHEDFVFIASANTYGNGANRQYVGRNQLDAATLDRFAVVDWYIDDELESNLAVGLNGKAWYMAVRAARDYVAEKNIRALISPRATQKGSKLLDTGASLDEVIKATMLASVPEDKRADVTQVATTIFNKFASEVPSKLGQAVNPDVRELIK